MTTDAMTERPDDRSRTDRNWRDKEDLPGSGRGIVICAGGLQIFTNAWVLVRHLRKVLRCELPIEVWHLGREEMSSGMRGMLEDEGATVIDALSFLSRFPARISDGWQLKPYALMTSGFREVLMLDADNIPVRDPTFLFDHPAFAEHGAIFWPDVIDLSEHNPIWQELGLPATRRTSFETGQIVIDKSRHRAALKATLELNEDAQRFYRLVYGDKDTFLAAWLKTGSPYLLIPHRPFTDRYVSYQRDFDGEALFQHRSNGKFQYDDKQPSSQAFAFEAECSDSLGELRRIWNGRYFEPPTRSPAAIRIEENLAGQSFIVSNSGEEDRTIELLVYWQIGTGRDHDHENWYVAETETGDPVLRIMDRHRVRHELRLREDGQWVETDDAASALCLSPMTPDAGGEIRHHATAFLRAVVAAVVVGDEWTPEAEEELRVTLTVLSKTDPLVIEDLAAYAERATDLSEPTLQGLQRLAVELKRVVDERPRRTPLDRHAEILFDRRHYVRP